MTLNERKGKERKGKERKRKERKGKERKGKERKGKERKGRLRGGGGGVVNYTPRGGDTGSSWTGCVNSIFLKDPFRRYSIC